jgi:regulatory protein
MVPAPTKRDRPDSREVAFRLLAQRPHTEAELRRKLARRGCEPDEVDRALARLRDLGYLDEAAFASALVARRSRTRGPALIAAELAAKGVSREVANNAVAELHREELLAAARRLVARGGDERRLAARLQRRGFPTEVIRQALS